MLFHSDNGLEVLDRTNCYWSEIKPKANKKKNLEISKNFLVNSVFNCINMACLDSFPLVATNPPAYFYGFSTSVVQFSQMGWCSDNCVLQRFSVKHVRTFRPRYGRGLLAHTPLTWCKTTVMTRPLRWLTRRRVACERNDLQHCNAIWVPACKRHVNMYQALSAHPGTTNYLPVHQHIYIGAMVGDQEACQGIDGSGHGWRVDSLAVTCCQLVTTICQKPQSTANLWKKCMMISMGSCTKNVTRILQKSVQETKTPNNSSLLFIRNGQIGKSDIQPSCKGITTSCQQFWSVQERRNSIIFY